MDLVGIGQRRVRAKLWDWERGVFLTLDAGVYRGRTVAGGPAADTGDYPVTGDVSDRLRWLPFHNGLTDAGMEQITGAVLGIQSYEVGAG